jgi:hypothetical protein
MGFDFSIELCICLCPSTGKPYVYHYEPGKPPKEYELPNIVVPEQHRRFVDMRGHFLHMYTDTYNDVDVYTACVDSLLSVFPSWDELKNNPSYDEYLESDWTESDHEAFKQALEWFVSQPYSFQASWSY